MEAKEEQHLHAQSQQQPRQSQHLSSQGIDMTTTTFGSITDTSEYIGKLLDGSGASQYLDYDQLGKKLEIIQRSNGPIPLTKLEHTQNASEDADNSFQAPVNKDVIQHPNVFPESRKEGSKTTLDQMGRSHNIEHDISELFSGTGALPNSKSTGNKGHGTKSERNSMSNRTIENLRSRQKELDPRKSSVNSNHGKQQARGAGEIGIQKHLDSLLDIEKDATRADNAHAKLSGSFQTHQDAKEKTSVVQGTMAPLNLDGDRWDYTLDNRASGPVKDYVFPNDHLPPSRAKTVDGDLYTTTPLPSELVSLTDISTYLVSHGLPSLPRSLETATSGSISIPGLLTNAQSTDLRNFIIAISNKISAPQKSESKVDHSLNEQISILMSKVNTQNDKNAQLSTRLDEMSKQAACDSKEIDALQFYIQEMKSREEAIQQRDIVTLESLKKKFGRHYMQSATSGGTSSGIDGFLLEVIRAYESKLELVEKGGDHNPTAIFKSILPRPIHHAPGTSSYLTLGTRPSSEQAQSSTNKTDNAQIEVLKLQLENATKALYVSNNEVESLKMQLLNAGKSSWTEDASACPMSTRKMIRRDKSLQSVRFNHIKQLSPNHAHNLLNDVCIRLSIREVEQLPAGIERIYLVLQLVGQMKAFIREVDAIVRLHAANPEKSDEPKKLSSLLAIIRYWGENTMCANDLTKFSQEIHKILNIQQRHGSDLHCLEEIRQLSLSGGRFSKRQSKTLGDDESDPAIHFRNLFNVPPDTDLISKINEVFVFCSEIRSRIEQLREVLHLDKHIQSVIVLSRSVDAIRDLLQQSTYAPDSFISIGNSKLSPEATPAKLKPSGDGTHHQQHMLAGSQPLEDSKEFNFSSYVSGGSPSRLSVQHESTDSPPKPYPELFTGHCASDRKEMGVKLEPFDHYPVFSDEENYDPSFTRANRRAGPDFATPNNNAGGTSSGIRRTPRHADSPIDGLCQLVGSRIVDESLIESTMDRNPGFKSELTFHVNSRDYLVGRTQNAQPDTHTPTIYWTSPASPSLTTRRVGIHHVRNVIIVRSNCQRLPFMSSRRSAGNAASVTRDHFKRLKELREAGTTNLRDYETVENVDIFDEVTEEEYNTLNKRSRLEDDFVVDDNGEGYGNNGLEDWDHPQSGQSSTDEDDSNNINDGHGRTTSSKLKGKSSKSSKRKRDKNLTNRGEPGNGASIVDMFNKQSKPSNGRADQKANDQILGESTLLLDSILDGLDDVSQPQKEKKRRSNVISTSRGATSRQSLNSPSNSLFLKSQNTDNSFPMESLVKTEDSMVMADNFNQDLHDGSYDDMDFGGHSPSYRPAVKLENSGISKIDPNRTQVNLNTTMASGKEGTADEEEFKPSTNDFSAGLEPPKVKIRKLQKSTAEAKSSKLAASFLPKFEQVEASLAPQPSVISSTEMAGCTSWKALKDTVQISEAVSKQPSSLVRSNIGLDSMLESDGSLRLYWFDCLEKNGVVYLFGKVFQPWTNTHVSCCVIVKNIQRNLFVLPRPTRLDATGTPTDIVVTMSDVYDEFDVIRQRHQISEFLSRPVTRKYAFEMPNIPSESEYLKVVYPFSEPELPLNTSGNTFSCIFGTRTRALELLILKRKLMGPCWISIKNAKLSSPIVSWCKLESTVDDPKDIRVLSDSDPDAPKQAPPFVVMSLSLRTYMNHQKQANEIVAASALVYNNVNIEGDTTDDSAVRLTVVRQLDQIPIPVEFMDLASKQRTKLVVLPNETSLLNYLLANIYQLDPDVLVGHNIVDFDLDVLLHRMKLHNTQNWSRIGRLRRSIWPVMQGGAGGTGDSSIAERQIATGRLMCDTYRAAQDLIRSKSYSLTSLAASQLKIERPNIDFDQIPSYFWNSYKLIEMVQHCEFDTFLTCQLMLKLQILPLTKQLTNLAGNIWARSLTGARAERNEYLLLHEFHEKKYICPDKVYNTRVVTDQLDENDATANGFSGKKNEKRKAAYAGGLVLEPKKGFYDKYVLMLDFNSLYPSIIQEYNICFTTISRTYDAGGDHMPDPPNPSTSRGILPRLLGTLVDRRRLVKGLMKDPKATSTELAQYDIRQKALKLTANSMYGCLGFSHSRFFAKPLAMLITSKGREILQNTVDLAEKSNLDVIYGDTDSIMIYTNTTDLSEVKRLGQELKKAVNKRYNLLEIELDGFYERMLLLKKKKYAAILVEEKDGQLKKTIEMKGLDLVRRDWCGLSFDASNYVLQQIFSGETREEVVERIHQYLSKFGEEVRLGSVPIEKFVINKGLTKNPESYADKETQPHVQVAIHLKARGISARPGDTIPYVICQGTTTHVAQRARHPDDVIKEGSIYKIDFDWYLSNQVHPPVTRLCQPIEGTDSARLANCLGLDMAKFSAGTLLSSTDALSTADVYTFESQISEEERFMDVQRWSPRCLGCGESAEFKGVVHIENDVAVSGLICPNAACGQEMPIPSLAVQLRVAICAQMRVYLDQSVVCDDPSCRNTTRSTSVFGRRCLVPGCKGTVSFLLSDRALYLQMQYFESLFDISRVQKMLEKGVGSDELANLVKSILTLTLTDIEYLGNVVERYLSINARRWVDLGKLFSFR
ncbi:hypothetical protein BASA60_007400 [Batrachochytrium salamandrivorans]|nr:hypothetical protein BASA60_007400 [Batrachochytrium salamandrivorans]